MKKGIVIGLTILFSISLYAADVVGSSAELERKASSMYSSKDQVLYNLDSGMLSYYEGKYSDTIRKLTKAEELIFDYYTKSITQNAAAFLTNDNVIEYPGEDYEDIYANLFKALAYYQNGQWEEGFHEVNAYQRKAQGVALRHNDELMRARQAAKMGQTPDANISFHDSALGQYLFMLYYRSIRDKNQVSYSGRMLKEAFVTSPDIYNFSVPASIDDEIAVSNYDARLNFVVFSGKSPYKVESTEYYSNELVLALPELEITKPKIRLIQVEAVNTSTGKKYTSNLDQIENFGNICADVFKSRSKVIYYKSLARAMTKAGTTASTRVASQLFSYSDDPMLNLFGGALAATSEASERTTHETEHADLRHSNYFPGRADVGGITVEPGVYDVTISYYSSRDSKPLYEEKKTGVRVSAGKMNLVSASSTMNELKDFPNDQEYTKTISTKTRVTVADTVDRDKIEFDIGTEPEAEASATYGFIQYNWNDMFGSNVKVKYTNSTQTVDEIDGYKNATMVTKSNEFEIDLLPLVCKFGDYITCDFSIGGSYQYISQNVFAGMFDTNGYMLDPIDKGKYFTMKNERQGNIVAPRIGASASVPFGELFTFNLQAYSNPVYCVIMKDSMVYHSDQTENPFHYGGQVNYVNWSKPYVEARVSLDCFKFIRLVAQGSYQSINFQQLDWSDDGERLIGYDDVQTMTKARVGLELLAGSYKKSRVRGGIYYQMEWNTSTYSDITTTNNKIMIGIGSER